MLGYMGRATSECNEAPFRYADAESQTQVSSDLIDISKSEITYFKFRFWHGDVFRQPSPYLTSCNIDWLFTVRACC